MQGHLHVEHVVRVFAVGVLVALVEPTPVNGLEHVLAGIAGHGGQRAMLSGSAGGRSLPATNVVCPTLSQLARRGQNLERGVDVELSELERCNGKHRGLPGGDVRLLALDDDSRCRLDDGVQLIDLVAHGR